MKQINIKIKKDSNMSEFRKARGRAKDSIKYEAQFLNDKSPKSTKSVSVSKKKK